MIVKSLSRGLDVLTAVNQYPVATVKQLVHSTQLPKPTLIRLLQSLVSEGYVMPNDDGSGYRVSARARSLTSGLDRSLYSEVATPHMKTLADTTKFPSTFHLREGNSMWNEVSNRDTAPIRLPLFGMDRAPILGSAVGIAYLTALSDEECAKFVDELLELDIENAFGDSRKILETVNRMRLQGYSNYNFSHVIAGLETIGMPVRERQRPIGAVALIYFSDIVANHIVRDKFIPALTRTVSLIEDGLISGHHKSE